MFNANHYVTQCTPTAKLHEDVGNFFRFVF